MDLTLRDPNAAPSGAGPLAFVADRLMALLRQPWFHYLTLLALQLKRIWGIWDYRELTGGDTCSYFLTAYDWFTHWNTNFGWSPLYTSFYGTFLYVTQDVAMATVLHRIFIILAATMLVLAVLRKMLPAEMAWLVGVWWAVLPINFNTMYEVHLFALLPLLIALLLVMSNRGPWFRGAAVAVLVANTFLVRNETVVAASCLIAVCFWWERRQRRAETNAPSGDATPERSNVRPIVVAAALVGLTFLALAVRHNGLWLMLVVMGLAAAFALWDRHVRRAWPASRPPLASLLAAYAVPIIVGIAVTSFFYHRSTFKKEALRASLESKHTVNMGQVYAFGYQQRHPHRWQNRSPWIDFPELCLRQFGVAAPRLTQMIRNNPKEVMRHFLWNFRLTPSGVQLMLFNAISGEINPDYDGTVHRGEKYALVLSIAALSVVGLGIFLLRWDREYWWWQWIQPRQLAWLAMFAVTASALLVIPTQRPRPSYLFGLAVLLMTVVGMAAFVVIRKLLPFPRLRALAPIGMIAMVILIPGFWAGAKPPGPSSIMALYKRLRPYQSLIDQPGRVFLVGDQAPHVHNYLGFNHGASTPGYDVFDQLSPDVTLAQFLDSQHVTMLYLDTRGWTMLEDKQPGLVRDFILASNTNHWRMIGSGELDTDWDAVKGPRDRSKWSLFLRTGPGDAGTLDLSFDPIPGTQEFDGWYPIEGFQAPEGPYPTAPLPLVRWGLGPVSRAAMRDLRGGKFRLDLCALTPVPDQRVTVQVDGKQITAFELAPGTWPDQSASFDVPPGKHEVEIGYTAWQSPTPTHHQALLFRRLRIVREEGKPQSTEKE